MILTIIPGSLQVMTKVIAKSAKQMNTINFPILIVWEILIVDNVQCIMYEYSSIMYMEILRK